jgi:hypothetical protein
MPRFYFHLEDSSYIPDVDGTELPDLRAARVQAAEMVGAMLKEDGAKFWETGEWRLVVTDEHHAILFRLEFRGTRAGPNTPLRRVK